MSDPMRHAMSAALARHLADDAADVVEHVRRRAIERVTAQLVDAYAIALLRRLSVAETPNEAPVQGPAESQVEQPTPAGRRGCYVYGVVDGEGTGAVTTQRGVQDAEVTPLRAGGLCALVSEVDVDALARLSAEEHVDDASPLAVAVRAHDAVVDAAFRAGAVIPLRFGTVVADAAGAADLVRAHADELHGDLRRISRAAEWTVTISLEQVVVPEPEPVAVQAETGRDYLSSLGRVKQSRTELRRRVDDAVTVAHRSLCALSLDSVRGHGAGDEPPVLKATYLVPRDADERFVRRCEELHQSLRPDGLRLELSGPWPAYHFVDVRLGEAVP